METVPDERRQRDRMLGVLGIAVAVVFLSRMWSAVLTPPSAEPTVPATIWFVVANATLLALSVWSVGRITGGYYERRRAYRYVVGVLSSVGIGAALVFLGYAIATYPGHL